VPDRPVTVFYNAYTCHGAAASEVQGYLFILYKKEQKGKENDSQWQHYFSDGEYEVT